jgi:hypothetical protein
MKEKEVDLHRSKDKLAEKNMQLQVFLKDVSETNQTQVTLRRQLGLRDEEIASQRIEIEGMVATISEQRGQIEILNSRLSKSMKESSKDRAQLEGYRRRRESQMLDKDKLLKHMMAEIVEKEADEKKSRSITTYTTTTVVTGDSTPPQPKPPMPPSRPRPPMPP